MIKLFITKQSPARIRAAKTLETNTRAAAAQKTKWSPDISCLLEKWPLWYWVGDWVRGDGEKDSWLDPFIIQHSKFPQLHSAALLNAIFSHRPGWLDTHFNFSGFLVPAWNGRLSFLVPVWQNLKGYQWTGIFNLPPAWLVLPLYNQRLFLRRTRVNVSWSITSTKRMPRETAVILINLLSE